MRARFTVILLACGVILPGVVFFLLHVTGPSDGVRLAPGQPVWQADGVIVTPLRPGGLRQGDVVLAIAGKSMDSWAQELFRWDLARPQWRVGQTITYTVLRHGHALDIPVTLEAYPLGSMVEQEWSTILYALVFLLVAVFVFVLRSGERAARVQLLMASSMVGATTWSFGLQVSDLVNGLGFWLFLATTLGIYLLFWSSLLHFALIFPRSHAITVKWRFVVPLLYTLPYACALFLIVGGWHSASSTLDWIGHWSLAENIFSAIYSILALLLVFWTYRTARDTTERKKIAWIVYAGFISVAGGLLLWQVPGLLGYSILSPNALGLLVLPYPFALAIAILRHHLFDIDLIIKRTLIYGILTVSVVGIYILIVSIVSLLFHPSSTFLPSLLATGMVAVLFQPLRARFQHVVNRLFYGERDDPYAVLARLSSRLETTLIPEAVLPAVVQTVAQALKLPYAAIALKQGETFAIVASYGRSQHELFTLPLVYHSETVGQLQLALRGPDEPFSTADRTLLAAIASQVGVAAHAVRLTADLQRSRERLVTAREEERRRLRRDLHDGLGPQLSSQTLTLSAIKKLLRQDPETAERLATDAITHAQEAIADIRRLVYALRPPALDDLGLLATLQEQMAHYYASDIQLSLSAPEALPPLPAALEIACYRIVQEALTNVVRHAHATHATVGLRVRASALEVEVRDDGQGLPAGVRSGVGLTSMRERAEELGGTCVVETRAEGGTRVCAWLPFAERQAEANHTAQKGEGVQ